MSEQVLMPMIGTDNIENKERAKNSLEKARIAHEKYLIGQRNNDLQEAVEHYVDAVKYDPTIPETYYRLATLMWEQGQIGIETAIEQCKTAISLSPNNKDAHLYTGYFMQLAQDFKSAEEEFKSAIAMNPLSSGRPRMILSQSILQKINTQNATYKDYAGFLYYFLTGSLMLAWDRPTMKMFYKNMTKDVSVFSYNTVGKFLEKFKMYDSAEKVYEQAVENTVHSELFYNKIGDLALKNRNIEKTVDCYRKVLEANPLNREILIKLATILQTYFPENTEEAIDCYERLLEFKIDTAQIYYELGHLYMSKEDKLNSISAFKLAVDHDPENPFFNNSLGYAYAKAELYDDAIAHYQKAISLNPDAEWTSIVCQALGSIYAEQKGNMEAAISTYQAGIILDQNNYDLYIALGDIYMADYDLDKAIRSYCDAVTLNPDDYRAYSKVGIALWEKDYLEEALVAYHKAVELKPENEYAQNNLGILYLDGLVNPEEALEYFEEAISLNPNYTLAYFNAGRASQELGFTNDAAHYYQMAIDLNRLTEELDEEDILARLHSLFEI
ncbi:MAG: tetratricopeptide repeat protein [Muribaculaceae bacterium]|nr:tetratricopeptide repeat protein [Muribaculaceae bacterium]